MVLSFPPNHVFHLRYCSTELDSIWSCICALKYLDERNHYLYVAQIDFIDFLKGLQSEIGLSSRFRSQMKSSTCCGVEMLGLQQKMLCVLSPRPLLLFYFLTLPQVGLFIIPRCVKS
jgi:hypothetical protein